VICVVPHTSTPSHAQFGGATNISILLSLDYFFLDKEYALISRRYQLYPASATTQCPSGHMDAHNQKRRRRRITKKKNPALANNSL
jgi:hypothetical protein